MLDPAGDAYQRGRTLCNGYERGETLKCAEALKSVLHDRYFQEVIIARTPGEEKLPLQVAAFANRMNVSLVINLSFYHEESSKPKAYIYQLTYNPLVDFAPRSYKQPIFIPVEQAHYKNIHSTQSMAKKLQSFLTQHHSKLLDISGPFGIPIKPLIGITSPALLIEIGIHEDDQWKSLIEPLATGLFGLLNKT